MNQIVIDAVKERISLGYTKEAISQELADGGYTPQEIEAFYQAATGSSAVLPPPTSPDPELVPSPEATPTSAPASDDQSSTVVMSEPVAGNRHTVVLVLVIGLVASVLLAAGYWVYTQGSTLSLSSLFSSAPYDTSSELFLGIAKSASELEDAMMAFQFHIDVELAEKAPGETVTVLSQLEEADELVAFTPVGVLPDEGHVRTSVTGLIDTRDVERPQFDLEFSVDALLEPFIAKAAGAVRYTEDSLYARVDDIPAMFEPAYEAQDLAPLGTWMLVGTRSELETAVGGVSSGLLPTIPGIINYLPETNLLSGDVYRALAQVPTINVSGSPQLLASLGSIQFRDGVNGGMITALLEQYPPLEMVGDPVRITSDTEDVYRYKVTFNAANFRAFATQVPDAIEDEAERAEASVIMAELVEEFPSQADLDAATEYIDTFIQIQPNGTFDSIVMSGAVTESPASASKLSFAVTLGATPAINQTIAAPTNVHPGSLIAAQLKQQQAAAEAAMIQTLSSLRSQAEVSYNRNDFSYANLCTELASDFRVSRYGFGCVATDDGSQYRVDHKWESKAGYFCIDSTGFAGEVDQLPADAPVCVVD